MEKSILRVMAMALAMAFILATFASCAQQGEQGPAGPQGEQGVQGEPGVNGTNGVDGKSAYELAVDKGYTGTVEEWLASLVGEVGATGQAGANGQSAYGSNNYKESAIRQFLNSPSAAGSVWTPQTKFDRPPSWMTSLAGFVGGFDDDFLSVIGEVVVPCSANNTYEAPDSTVAKGEKYTVTDKFYLASQREIFGNNSDSVADDSVLFPYYEGADAADRIKYRDGSAASWWMRTPYSWYASNVRGVYSTGTLGSASAIYGHGCSPACTIV